MEDELRWGEHLWVIIENFEPAEPWFPVDYFGPASRRRQRRIVLIGPSEEVLFVERIRLLDERYVLLVALTTLAEPLRVVPRPPLEAKETVNQLY